MVQRTETGLSIIVVPLSCRAGGSALSPPQLSLSGVPGLWPAEGSAGVGWLPLCSPDFATACLVMDTKGTPGKVRSGLLVVPAVCCYSALSVTFCLHAFIPALYSSLSFVPSLLPCMISNGPPGSWPHLIHI